VLGVSIGLWSYVMDLSIDSADLIPHTIGVSIRARASLAAPQKERVIAVPVVNPIKFLANGQLTKLCHWALPLGNGARGEHGYQANAFNSLGRPSW
jgi:hypothetical protein